MVLRHGAIVGFDAPVAVYPHGRNMVIMLS
jgi:hypothetical protein